MAEQEQAAAIAIYIYVNPHGGYEVSFEYAEGVSYSESMTEWPTNKRDLIERVTRVLRSANLDEAVPRRESAGSGESAHSSKEKLGGPDEALHAG